ncbi:MAG: AAA family ATPase [Actinomycetota bacterium]
MVSTAFPSAPPAAAGATRIQLCGRLKADVEGRHVTPALRGRQGRVLLAYLALNRGRPVSRDELIGAIWPDAVPADPAAALRTQLSRLRSALGTDALAGRDAVELRLPENTWIDVEAAENSIQAGEAALAAFDWKDAWAHAHIALNISGRPFLPGFDAPWVEEVRGELKELQTRARESIARAGIGLGGSELAGAERSARELIRAAAFRESGYLLLMRALVASGNTAEALRTYDELRKLLAKELGTAPGAEIQALHRRLLSGSAEGAEGAGEADEPEGPSGELPLPNWLTPSRRSPLIGRDGELTELGAIWAEAAAGRRQIVMVRGDPGVGKTRLVTEYAERAHEQGATVLYGRADEEGVVTYQPFVEALRHWAINAPVADLERDLGPHAGVLSRLVPEIAARLPNPPEPGAEELERELLFDAVTGTLAAIASTRPALLLIDDLHWADTGSLRMLRHIARSPHGAGLMVLGTYRETEPSDALTETLADLGRERLFERIHLGGLGTDDTRVLVASVQGSDPGPQLARTIHNETGGNPFLVEALAQHLSEDEDRGDRPSASPREALYAGGVPSLVREAVAHRVGGLGEAAERVLKVASVVGVEFEPEILAEVSGLPSDEVVGALESALAAGLLADVPGTFDRYAFSHALFRQAIYSGLSKGRRAMLHQRLAETLERHHGPDPRHVAELARHFSGAGPRAAPKALEYCVRAGAAALGSFAYEEAIDHYSRALSAIEAAESEDEGLRCEVLLALGESEWRAGMAGAARETFARAARLARRNGDADALGRAALGFCAHGWERVGVPDSEAEDLLNEANAAKPEEAVLRAQLTARLGELLYFSGELKRADELTREAIDTARAAKDSTALAAALIGRWYACLRPEGLEERLELTRDLIELTGQLRDRDLAIQAQMLKVSVSLEVGDTEVLDRAIAEHERLAEQSKQPSNLLHSRAYRAMRALMEGRFEEVEDLASEVLELGTLAQSPNAVHYSGLELYLLRSEQGRLSEVEGALQELTERYSTVPAWRAPLAFLYSEMGRDSAARAELEALADDDFAALPRDATWLPALGFLSLTCASLGDVERAASIYELLLPLRNRPIVVGGGGAYASTTSHYLGVLAGVAGRWDDAVELLTEAVERNSQLGARPWLARCQYGLARALNGRAREGDSKRADELISEATAIAHDLGMERLLELIRGSDQTAAART